MPDTVRSAFGNGSLSLDHLIALNDEIAALARAGLPLERGLREVGRDHSGNLNAAMVRLSERMGRGENLKEALDAEGDRFPPIYRAVVGAGLRAGRLPAALEGLAGFIRGYVEARRAIGLALWYPLVVLVLAYALFIFMLTQVIPRFVIAYDSLRVPSTRPLQFLQQLGNTVRYWGPVLPVILLVLAAWWTWSGRASSFRGLGLRSPLRWFPWMGSLVSQFEASNFATLLAILLEQAVPLPEAITLASSSSGDAGLAQAGQDLASDVERGLPPNQFSKSTRAFPPLLRWLLATSRLQGDLPEALRQISRIYRKRAAFQAEKIKVFLPTILLLAIGMSATLCYGLTLFLPFTSLLKGISNP